jgi:hypothetical protein
MIGITSPSAAIIENPTTDPDTAPLAAPDTAPLTDSGDIEVTPEEPATARRAFPSAFPSGGTGGRQGLIRARTVRSNTVRALLKMREDRGAATAEYIVATMAAVGFAGLLIVILRGDEVRGILTELVRSALSVG